MPEDTEFITEVSLAHEENQLVDFINGLRELRHINAPPMTIYPVLESVAKAHSEDMFNRSFYGHTNPDGETLDDRLTSAGLTYISTHEIIAKGFTSAEHFYEILITGNAGEIISDVYTHIGVGISSQEFYWTIVLVEDPNP